MRPTYRHALVPALGALLLVAAVTDSMAQRRPDVRTMTCDQARNLVVQNGAIVVTTGRHTFDRYIAYPSMCVRPHRATGAWVATRDTQQCLIGYQCAPGD